MAINSRNSEDHLSRDVILGKISEYDIFRYYCSPFRELNTKFCSELRQDKSPTVSIIKWNSKLLYKDFGYEDHTFDCFSYIQCKYNVTFFDCLRVIDTDFNLRLAHKKEAIAFTKGYLGYKYDKIIQDKKVIIIKKKRRKWNSKDKDFWSPYGISKKTLIHYNVEPLEYYWVNYDRFKCNSITYSYKIGNKYKIYAPYNGVKWTSNTTKNHIQGFKQLDTKGNLLIITSSLKDVMCLCSLGYSSIALQSEMQMPSEELMNELKNRFKTIMLLYDNDFLKDPNPGQVMAHKICNKYNIINLCLLSGWRCKDISDLVKASGFNVTKVLLKDLIYEKEKK